MSSLTQLARWTTTGMIAGLLNISAAHAGVVVNGTRFVMAAPAKSINVAVKNTSQSSFLIKSKVVRGGGHDASGSTSRPSSVNEIPFVITPPLFVLGGMKSNQLRLECTGCETLPKDKESLYYLSISAIPGGKAAPNSIQVAIRSTFKLFYRPEGLEGNANLAYQKLQWQRQGSQVTVKNPSPYFVTLYRMKVNGTTLQNAGMVSPLSSRTESWCPATGSCAIQWQTLDDFGGERPVWHITPEDTSQVGSEGKSRSSD